MIHRLIIPGIITGALHGGLFLIPNPPAPPVEKTGGDAVLVEFVPPPLPEVPIDIDEPPRSNDDDKAVGPPVPFVPPTPVAPINPYDISEPLVPDLPRPDINSHALSVGLGDYAKRGLPNGESSSKLFSIVELDKTPRTIFQIAPDYPSEARRNYLTGTVTVMFRVDENGDVHDARVTNTSDNVFNESALRAVSQWRFEPGRLHGRRVAFKMSVPIAFNLSDAE